MGINNLLKFMKPYVESVHIKKYAGKRVGIDAYSWLHKGAYSCSMELCLNMEGDKKFQYLNYFTHRINLLRHHKITPVVVFDGGNIPCKAATEEERHRRRKANRDMAMEKLKAGDANAASEIFQRAVSITPLMAHQLVQILRSENIEFVVAPYEADAQLAYLSTLKAEEGGIAAVISEDSDLLAYSCPAIIFKMDRYGNGEEIILDKVLNAVGCVPSFQKFDESLFTGMCILAGCDFLPSVPGIGIAKAYNLVSKFHNLDRVLSTLKFEKGRQMPEDYPKAFKEAVAVFRHARIYDANLKRLKHLKPLTPELLQRQDEELDFLGPDLPPSLATAIAEGNIDPSTMEAFDHIPQFRNHHPTILGSPNRHLRQDATALSPQESCFTVISCHKISKQRIKGNLSGVPSTRRVLTNTLEKRKLKPTTEEVLHSNETLALEKLAFPISNEASKENKKVTNGIFLDIPNNNPFKKRKLGEVILGQADEVVQQSSEVIEIENSEIMFVTTESQESVKSKPFNISQRHSRNKSEKKLNKDHSQCSETKKNSILNFFSRV
ncbi:exonuclease 1 isoform X2 [Olea europaea var. sylvestris]|uniref:exonuclease 1 isoform X2 n=1 Tax=Olea europaea var. sylvestris TaxID=158386 RepID=UPI000C1D7A45|nr:exonuclease 1 isoform X2 [Olea europaea var. sylvestris]